jgi:outer membrane protein TolC
VLLCACCLCLPAWNVRAQAPGAPITLEQSVQESLRLSPQVRAARASLETSRVQADREKPVARPTVTAVASGTVQGPRVSFPRPDGQLATVLPEGVGRLDLVVEQPLYRAGVMAARDRYQAQLSAGELDFRKTLNDVALAARKAYIDVLRSDAGVRSAKDSVDAAERYHQLVEHQITAGIARPVDAKTVEAQVAEARSGLTQAEGGAALARFNFNRLLGRTLEAPVVLAEIVALPPIPTSPAEAIARALRSRPELLLLEQNLQAARAGILLARSQSQPAVNARGQLTEQTPSAFLHEHYYAVTLELRWPLLDGGKARQDTREARSQADRVLALLDDARQGVELENMQAWEKMREAQSRIDLARIQRSGTEATAQVAEKAYEVGRGTVLEVQAAQREVRGARASELRALYDLHAGYADFLYAQGDLLNGLQIPMVTESRP